MGLKNTRATRSESEETMDNISPGRSTGYKPSGRLGEPQMDVTGDPRTNKKLVEVLKEYGLDRDQAPPSLAHLNAKSTMEELGLSMWEAHTGFEKLYEALPNELSTDAVELEVIEEGKSMKGGDGQELKLHIFRPALRGGPLPCVVFFHGGGMVIMKTMNKINRRWCKSLAAQGMVAIAVEFRTAWTDAGFNPFPRGLNDCCAAVQWIHANKGPLNIRNIVLQGDGGGANLALATTLQAKRAGWWPKIDGVYACSPYISNAYGWSKERQLEQLPSLVECNGYFSNVNYLAYMAHVYTPKSEDQRNSLAWPYHAEAKDLECLPPHVIAMDELDPLRDEGMAYYRKLSAAGTRCVAQVNLGHTHSASLVFRQALPDDNRAAIKNIAAFAKSV